MIDGIIKADGTSRLMRATLPATYEAFRAAAAAGTLPLDVLFNESGWSQQPTFLNKANLLTDATAALFGLGAEAVPDNAFSFLGKYNQHWWRRRQKGAHYELKEETNTNAWMYNSAYTTYAYSDSVNVSESGEITLAEPVNSQRITGLSAFETFFPNFLGKYFTVDNEVYNGAGSGWSLKPGTVYYLHPNSKCYTDYDGDYAYGMAISRYSAVYVTDTGDWNYLQSADRNAYPDSGEVDSYEYNYLGVPLENAVTAPGIATGSYAGTGTYGLNNPCVIPLSFEPKFVLVAPINPNFYASNSFISWFFWLPGMTKINARGSDQITISVTEGKFSFYSTNAAYQLNESNKEYRYIILD